MNTTSKPNGIHLGLSLRNHTIHNNHSGRGDQHPDRRRLRVWLSFWMMIRDRNLDPHPHSNAYPMSVAMMLDTDAVQRRRDGEGG